MGKIGLVAAVVGLFLLILVVTVPARVLGNLLPADQVAAFGYEGTLWNGSVSSAALILPQGTFELGSVSWKLSPWSLLLFSPRAWITSRWGLQVLEGDISASGDSGLRLRDTTISFPAELVRQWLPIQVEGSLNLQLPGITLVDAHPVAGEGRLVWQAARWIGSRGSQPLGDFVLAFHIDEKEVLQGKLNTLQGPLRVSGTVALDRTSYSIDAEITSRQALDPELRGALELMASPVDNGYHLKLNAER